MMSWREKGIVDRVAAQDREIAELRRMLGDIAPLMGVLADRIEGFQVPVLDLLALLQEQR